MAAPKKTTAKKATAKKAPAKKAAAKKATTKTSTVKKATPRKANTEVNFRDAAEKVVNIYLGVIGQSIDSIRENLESARKDNDKRVKVLEKRGTRLRAQINNRIDNIELPEIPEMDEVVDDVKAQFNKLQDQVEDAVDNVREKLTPVKKAA